MNALAQSTGNSFQNSGGGGDYAKYTGSLTPMPTPQLQGLFQDALRLTGESANSANINALMNIAKAESSYEPGATYQGPLVPGVTATNRPTGLMQVEPQTFAANAMSGYSNIKNPLDNVIAAINYMKKEYGGIQQAYTYRQAHGAY
jgi:SLT domain-containing protein